MSTEKPLATAWPAEFAWIIPMLRLEAKPDGADDARGGEVLTTHGVLVGTVPIDEASLQTLDDMVQHSLNFYRVPDPLTSEHLLVRFNARPRCLSTREQGGVVTHQTHIELRILPSR